MEYTKPPLAIEDQTKLLKKRGLLIDDEAKTSNYLKNISYYHLSAYFKSFQDDDDKFKSGTSFKDIVDVYIFDQKLRLLLLDVLERIEKSFKCRMAYELAIKNNDSHWILNTDLFDNQGSYNQFIVPCVNEVARSRETCVMHYYQTYQNPKHPPIWIMLEVLSFGSCVTIYRQLKISEQKTIARSYDLAEKFLINWMQALSRIRNICAHHSRLWNANINLKLKQQHRDYEKFFHNLHTKKSSYAPIFDYLVVLQIVLCKIYPGSEWDQKLHDIIVESDIDIARMGFPDDWKQRFQKIREAEEIKIVES